MKCNRKNENGIALLFTLGMLSLLLVMAIAFASMSMMSRKTASNNADLTLARILAQSAVQRALGAMRFYRESGGSQYDNIISHDASGGVNQKTYDWLYGLNTIIDGATIYQWPIPYDPNATDAIHWQYIDNGRTGAEQRIIGRLGYKVYGSGGKLDPSACVRHTAATTGVPAGTAVREVIDPAPSLPTLFTDTAVRNGNYTYEINIKNLNRTDNTNIPVADVIKMSTDKVTGGLLGDGERWSDFGTLFSMLGISTANKKEKWRSWFDIERPVDAEAFWEDTDGNGMEEPSELYHRFNVGNRTAVNPGEKTWENITVANIIGDAANYDATLPTHEGTGIKYLKNFATSTPAVMTADTFPNAAAKANQIAANLIDYCDSNRTSTTDNENAPTYTGNDQTPYINEVQIMVDAEIINTPFDGVDDNYDLALFLVADVEVVNIYDTTDNNVFNLDAEVTVSGSYRWGPKNYTRTFTDVSLPVQINAVGDRCYKTGTSAAVDVSDATWKGAKGQTKKIDNFQFTKINVKLTKNGSGEFYDYSYVENDSGLVMDIKSDSGDNARYYYFSFEVDDPRQNLNVSDWADNAGKGKVKKKKKKATSENTLGARNSSAAFAPNPGGSKDVETGLLSTNSDPWDVSTAYIRNSYMRSPWEIGFIHRAAEWETLRIYLYNYSTTLGVGPTDGISTWANGDAAILDQIKMTNDVESFGKVNVNSTSADVLKALVGSIRIGVSPLPTSATVKPYPRLPNASRTTNDGTDDSNPGALSYGAELDYATDVINMVAPASPAVPNSTNSIMNPSTASFKPYKSRAQIVRSTTCRLTNGTECTQTTDALKEEIIGKFINLAKASPDTVTIIAIAQTIKDIGGGVTVYKDLDSDGDVDGNVTENGYDIDGKDSDGDGDYTNDHLPTGCETISTEYGRYDQYAEEILAEQKIMGTVIYDQTTQKWRILRYEYLE